MRRLEEWDRSREEKSVRLQEARGRLQRLREAAAAQGTVSPVAVPDVTSEMAHLRDMVSQLQAQLAKSEQGSESPTKKRVRPECFVCHTVEELIEWMDARQSDMRVGVEVGNAPEISGLAVLLAEGAGQLKSWTLNPSMASNTVT